MSLRLIRASGDIKAACLALSLWIQLAYAGIVSGNTWVLCNDILESNIHKICLDQLAM